MNGKSLADGANPEVQSSQTAAQTEARIQVIRSNTLNLWFSRFASRTAQIVGHPYIFVAAVAVILIWGVTGPWFHYSDTWQLIINTGTSVLTFLVVFLIQNTQNRDTKALHLKLDELIRSHSPAHNDMIDIQKLSDEELDKLAEKYAAIRAEYESRKICRDKIIGNKEQPELTH